MAPAEDTVAIEISPTPRTDGDDDEKRPLAPGAVDDVCEAQTFPMATGDSDSDDSDDVDEDGDSRRSLLLPANVPRSDDVSVG